MKAREELKIRFEVVVWFNDVRNEQKAGVHRNEVLCKMFSWYSFRGEIGNVTTMLGEVMELLKPIKIVAPSGFGYVLL